MTLAAKSWQPAIHCMGCTAADLFKGRKLNLEAWNNL